MPPADRELLAMRCGSADAAALDARLATWPELFSAIDADFGGQFTCLPSAERNFEC